MKLSSPVLCSALLVLAVVGCGPMQAPMPVRLEGEGQKQFDEAWNDALRPVDRFDHQTVLDFLMVTQAYQMGVDRLTFRSEKKVAVGKVVMEISFDRLRPAEDRFVVQILDDAGQVLRKEEYAREDVERTYRDLFVDHQDLQYKKDRGTITPEEARRLADHDARIKAVEAVFPDPEEKKPGKKVEAKQG